MGGGGHGQRLGVLLHTLQGTGHGSLEGKECRLCAGKLKESLYDGLNFFCGGRNPSSAGSVGDRKAMEIGKNG